jgi:hypothetical protein
VDLRYREVGASSTYAKPQKIRLKGIQNFIASSVQENFFSVFSIASSAQEKFFGFFLSLHRFFGFFYRFIGAGKLFIVFFYRFIGEKNFAQQNCIALFDFFLKNCVSVSL